MAVVSVVRKGESKKLVCREGSILKDVLVSAGIYVDAPCGGNGKCGKCIVKAEGAVSAPCSEELGLDTENGFRLACLTRVLGDCSVTVFSGEEGMEVSLRGNSVSLRDFETQGSQGLGAGIDVGTTTVVCRLFNMENGEELGAKGALNLQRSFGADVISRIGACINSAESQKALSETIRSQIRDMLSSLCERVGRKTEEICRAVIAGNTTMAHLFCGLDPSGLGSAPFTPVSMFGDSFRCDPEGLGVGENCEVYVVPAAASFVGGDITAAAVACGMDIGSKTEMLIDIGTNGEIVLCNGGQLWCCATAAGPAFEGADISCGMGGTDGAIRRADVGDGGELTLEVMGNGAPAGVCGSGLVDLLAAMLSLGALENTGRMLFPDEAPPFAEKYLREDDRGEALFAVTDTVFVTAGDIRKLQLAKAAIAAGARTLMDKAGVKASEIENLWIAGGFGNNIRVENAAAIGLIPPELAQKAVSVGNAAAEGACRILCSDSVRFRAEKIGREMEYVELSADPVFMEHYVNEMFFGEEE
ncbi:MAG: DUF4445 domain-containing protein [Clostridia bacterium]|nr:DUF4445 domain-containing protein [Clostridia bacterium]